MPGVPMDNHWPSDCITDTFLFETKFDWRRRRRRKRSSLVSRRRKEMRSTNSNDRIRPILLSGTFNGVQRGSSSLGGRNVRLTTILSFRDDEYLFATVDWGQKLTLYQATDAKQVHEDRSLTFHLLSSSFSDGQRTETRL